MDNIVNSIVKHRKELHQIPEISFDLPKTNAYLCGVLEDLGYELEEVAQTGLVAIRKGESDEFIAFRSDMDALRVTENTGLNYKSKHHGQMHACGHDGHMSILLGFAEYLTTIENLKKSVMMIFQPAEESPGGAKVIVEEGLFDRYDVKGIFGIHLFPNLEEGQYGLVDGPMMPQSAEFYLDVHGVSAHGAQPHLGKDAIVAAANLVCQYQTIGSRSVNPLESSVVSIGMINGGEALNIIANKVSLSGTIRAYSIDTYLGIKEKMSNIVKGIESSFGVKIDNEIIDFYPPVVNDSQYFNMLVNSLDETDVTLIPPMMLAEDFSYYLQKVPGMFVMLGTKNEALDYIYPLHNDKFNFRPEALIKGVNLYIKICEELEVF